VQALQGVFFQATKEAAASSQRLATGFFCEPNKQSYWSKRDNLNIFHHEPLFSTIAEKDTARRNECCDGLLFPPEQSLLAVRLAAVIHSASNFCRFLRAST
jgi:hypothetical protein